MTSSWRAYNTIPILEDSFTNGKGLNWSNDCVLTLPTYYKKRHFAETDDPQQKNIRVERRHVGIRLFSLQHPGVLAENARTCFENNFDRIKEVITRVHHGTVHIPYIDLLNLCICSCILTRNIELCK